MQTALAPDEPGDRTLSVLLDDLPFDDSDVVVAAGNGSLTLGELRERSTTQALREAGVAPGHPVGNLVIPGPSSVVAMFATWAAGGVYVPVNARYTAAETRALLAETPIAVVLAPAMITMLADATDVTDLAPLRLVRSITAPLSPEATRRFHERFGIFVLNCYGQTELGGEVAGWTAADVREFGLSKLGAAGRPYQDVDIQIRGDDGAQRPAGEPGEIYVRSPYRMHGYALANGTRADPANDRLVDGYLRTGDIGWLDGDGFLWVRGRLSDMINRGGLKVYPDEVEEALREHPLVADAGVAGVPDGRLGEVPYAWLVVTGEVSAQELESWCRQRLAPYKVPVRFSFMTSLPRSGIGKLLRSRLADGARAQPCEASVRR